MVSDGGQQAPEERERETGEKGKKAAQFIREPSPSAAEGQESKQQVKARPKHHKKWKRRFRWAFCCLSYKRNKESITDVASLFAEYFADLNVPSSDIVAGMVLLSKFQAAQQQFMVNAREQGIEQILHNIPIRADTKFLDLNQAADSYLVNDMIYYMNYSLAIFGWPLQMFEDPCDTCCLWPRLRLCACCSSSGRPSERIAGAEGERGEDENNNNKKQDDQSLEAKREAQKERQAGVLEHDFGPVVEQDNCCRCNEASAEQRLDEHNFEIIHITYQSAISVVPFLVAADHAKQTVVVGIRGSMSLSDVITDMQGQAEKMPLDGCPDDWLSHRGMTRAASHLKRRLLEQGILERAFNCRPDWNSPNYGLLLCGHSLGAGVAAILGVLLKPVYPNLRAYLYSPPGGILSLPVVEHTKEFAVGVILGNDTVARLGIAQMERLRYQVLLALKNSNRRSGRVLAKALCPSSCCGHNSVEYDPQQSVDLVQSTHGKSFEYHGKEVPFQTAPSVLYVPGRLVHIVRNNAFKLRRSKPASKRSSNEIVYQAIWSTDNTLYDRIFLNDNMFLDHMPNRLMASMKMLFTKTLPDRRDTPGASQQVRQESSLANDRQGGNASHDHSGPKPDPTHTTNSVIETAKADVENTASQVERDTTDNQGMYPILKQP